MINHLGIFNSGSSGGGGSSSILNNVATNADKLALTGLTGGEIVSVDQEAARIEMFVGGDATQDANWAVLRNTINLTINPSNSQATYNGVILDGSTIVNVGWVDPTNIPVANADDGISYISYSDSDDQNYAQMEFYQYNESAPFDIYEGRFALPIPVPPRATVYLSLIGNDGG